MIKKYVNRKRSFLTPYRPLLYAALILCALNTLFLVIIYIPHGKVISTSGVQTNWKQMMSDTLKQRKEDGTSFGYYDRCGDDGECRTCKESISCLSCLNSCYNRHGAFYKKENPRLAGAMLCSGGCIEQEELRQIKMNPGFSSLTR